MLENLLRPGKIGNLQLKNRIIYPGMTFRLGDNKGHLTAAEVDSMVYRAEQEYGPALITFPGLNDSMFGKVNRANINDDEPAYILAKQIQKVKINDTKTMAILGVMGLRDNGYNEKENLGPSNLIFPFETKEMTIDEIQFFIYKFGKLAARAKQAGFDAIRIQTGTSKKVLDLFVSPYTNRRKDQYGGSLTNRMRIVIELLEEVRRQVGEDYPIIFNLQVQELIKHGTTIQDGIEMAKLIAPYVDAFEPVTAKRFKGTSMHGSEAYFTSYGPLLPYVRAIKDAVPEKTVIASVRMGIPELAEKTLANGDADFVSLGRPLFADPEWITKAAKGQTQEIVRCIGCMNCYTEGIRKELFPAYHRACTVNPANLREKEFYHLEAAEDPKKILVVGGGLAGMEAAITLAARGHDVTLCEQNKELGGQWIVASHGEEKGDYKLLIPFKKRQLEKNRVKVCLGTTVDKNYLRNFNPDVTILATGALPRELHFDFPLGDVQVVQGNDVIMDKVQVGDEVVVVGGRYIGMEVAAKLAAQGKHVSIVDMAEIGKGQNPLLFDHYLNLMHENHVELHYNTPVVSFTSSGVDVLCSTSLLTLQADTIVLAVGTKPEDSLKKDLEELNFKYCMIGDCKRIGDALYAIRDGAEVGRII